VGSTATITGFHKLSDIGSGGGNATISQISKHI